jgi:hypothetical protein
VYLGNFVAKALGMNGTKKNVEIKEKINEKKNEKRLKPRKREGKE